MARWNAGVGQVRELCPWEAGGAPDRSYGGTPAQDGESETLNLFFALAFARGNRRVMAAADPPRIQSLDDTEGLVAREMWPHSVHEISEGRRRDHGAADTSIVCCGRTW